MKHAEKCFCVGCRGDRNSMFTRALVLAGLLLLAASNLVKAQFTYTTNVNPDTITITGYTGANGSVTIPATINGFAVGAIGANAFFGNGILTNVTIGPLITNNITLGPGVFCNCSNLNTVTFDTGATTIGNSNFLNCVSLTNIELPTNVISIGTNAFENCKALASIVLPNSLTNISFGAFLSCGSLSSVSMSSNVTTIGSVTFESCSNLAGISLPGRLATLGSSAFFRCMSLTNIILPASFTSMGPNAFENCTALQNVIFSATNNSFTVISNTVFEGCADLTNVVFPANLTSIQASAFSGCTNLLGMVFPPKLTNIASDAFLNCKNLTSLVFSTNNILSAIGAEAFSGCTGLTNVDIPNSVTNLGTLVFLNCSNLTAINVSPTNRFYSSVAGVLFNASQTSLLEYPPGLAGSYNVPNGVTNLSSLAFENSYALTSITIPSGVTMGSSLFLGCSGLVSVTLPPTLTNIPSSTFSGCGSLANITIPNSVSAIGADAFLNCSSLVSITIPSEVTSIGTGAFEGCTSLVSVSLPMNLTAISVDAFFNCTSLAGIIIPNGVTNIEASAFSGCSSLANVIIPSSVTIVGSDAFANCPNISVYFTGNEPSNNGTAFSGDTHNNVVEYLVGTTGWGATYGGVAAEPLSLPGFAYTVTNQAVSIIRYTGTNGSVVIPDKFLGLPLTSIGPSTFANAAYITNISISTNITTIGNEAFANTGLQSLDISANVTNIGGLVFLNCGGLTNISVSAANPDYSSTNGVLFDVNELNLIDFPAGLTEDYAVPSTVTNIGPYSFAYSGLTGITIPSSVTGIGSNAFYGCSFLASVNIPASVASIGNEAFADCVTLTNISVDPGNPDYSSTNGALLDKAQTTLIQFPAGLNSLPLFASVTSVGDSALAGCVNLTAVVIPQGVQIIGDPVFYGCTNLTSVSIPASVTTIGLDAFASCTSLTNISVDPSNPYFSSLGGVLFDKSQATLIQYPLGLQGGYVIPDTVTAIGSFAFNGCAGLTSVTIDNNVTNIGTAAFAYCASLTNIGVASSNSYYTSAGGVLFDITQTNLVAFPGGVSGSYTIPGSITNILEDAFAGCSLSTVILGANLVDLGDAAFADSPNINSVYFLGNAPAVDFGTAFENDNSANVYYLPGASGWSSGIFGGVPTTIWNVQSQNCASINGTFSFDIVGPANTMVVIETCTNLANPQWLPVVTNTCDTNGNSSFSDSQSQSFPLRFYRLGAP